MKATFWDWFIVACLGVCLLGSVALSHAGNVVHKLGDGESVQFRCDGGTLTTEKHNGSVAYWKCTKSGGPVDPPVDPPIDPTNCSAPAYRVGSSKPVPIGQEIITLQQNRTTVRTFNSSQYPNGVYVSWGPYGSGGPRGMSVSFSQCPGDFDLATVDRACISGAPNGGITAGPGAACKLKPNTEYVVNLAPHYLTTGKYSCPGACQLTFFAK